MRKNVDAINMLADMLEPAVEIFSDQDIIHSLSGEQPIKAISGLLKKYPEAVLKIVCAYDGINYEDADYSVVDIIGKVTEIVGNPDVMGFLSAQAKQQDTDNTSGSATVNTRARRK